MCTTPPRDRDAGEPALLKSAVATMAESPEARQVIADVRARFQVKEPSFDPRYPAQRSLTVRPVLPASVVERFDRDGAWIRPRLPDHA